MSVMSAFSLVPTFPPRLLALVLNGSLDCFFDRLLSFRVETGGSRRGRSGARYSFLDSIVRQVENFLLHRFRQTLGHRFHNRIDESLIDNVKR